MNFQDVGEQWDFTHGNFSIIVNDVKMGNLLVVIQILIRLNIVKTMQAMEMVHLVVV